MKKFNKSGHLQGNASLPRHASPFIQGTVATNSTGYIATLQSAATPWFRQLKVTTDVGTIDLTLSNVNTNSTDPGHLATIVTYINGHSSNNNIVTASVHSGALLLETPTAGPGAFIRIDATSSYPNAAIDFGFHIHPHSQATVYYNDIKSAAVNSLTQKNPTGTTFIAKGEDRSSLNYNRGLYSVASNTDSHESMLTKGVARLVSVKIPIDSAGTNPRFVVDTASNTVKAINMSSSISDAISSSGLLNKRILVGTLTNQSTLREIRRFYQVADSEKKEILQGLSGLPVRVSGVITGTATGSNPVGPFTLDSTPSSTLNTSTAVGDNNSVLSADIGRGTGTQTIAVTKVHDAYTLQCDTGVFIDTSTVPNVPKVFAGDKLVLAGSVKNNGIYIVENVISATMLEVRPASYSDIDELDASDSTGSISISTGGMFIKDVTLFLTERLQLPLPNDIYITLPVENIIGDLDEDALISQSNIEVPYWVLKNIYLEKSLDGVYKGMAAGRKAAGYYIDADIRPVVTNITNYRENSAGSVNRTINTVDIKSNNLIQITQASADIFTDADVGRFVRFNVANPTGIITDDKILNQELAVITSILDSKTVTVKKVSRDTADLPILSVTSIDIVTEVATPFLPGASVSVSNEEISIGGDSRILESPITSSTVDKIEPHAFLTSAELVRIHKLSDTLFTPIWKITTSGDIVSTTAGIDGTYINLSYPNNISYPTSVLLFRIYNGPNAGWYCIKNVTNGLPPTITVSTLKSTTVTFDATSVDQYASIYRVAEGSRLISVLGQSNQIVSQRGISAAANESDVAIGSVITWKGEGSGLVVHSNYYDPIASNVYTGYGSKGVNIQSYAGPGSQGVYSVSVGVAGFQSSNMSSSAEITVPTSQGLGGAAIHGAASTYHLDPLNSTLPASSFRYRGGAGFFESATTDPALIVTMTDKSVNVENAASASLVAINTDITSLHGQAGSAVAIYGGVFAPTLNSNAAGKEPYVFYTEHTLSASNILPSEPEEIDITDATVFKNIIGTPSIVARSHHTDSTLFKTRVSADQHSMFNIQHDMTLKVQTTTQQEPGVSYPSFFGLDSYQDAIGCFVFFPEMTTAPGDTTFATINSSIDNTLHDLPFKLHNTESIKGCKIGFKIVACKVDVSDPTICWFALSAGKRNTLSSTIALSTLGSMPASTVFYKNRFTANLDLGSYTRIDGDINFQSYTYIDTSTNTTHRAPLLITQEIDQSVSNSELDLTNGLSKGSISSKGITKIGYPLSESSLVKTPETNVSTVLLKPFDYINLSHKNYQSPDYAFKLSDDVVPGFPVDNIAKKGQELSYGAHSIYVTSSSLNDEELNTYCTVASSSKHVNKFKGGGKKLVLSAKENTLTLYTLSVKVGANHIKGVNGLTFEITLANSSPNNRNIFISLCKEKAANTSGNVGIVTRTVSLYDNSAIPDIHFRSYQKISVTFSKDEIASVRDPSEIAAGQEDLFINVSGLDLAPGYLEHTGIASQSTVLKRRVGMATGYITEITGYTTLVVNGVPQGQQPNYERTDDRSLFPDLWYIYDIDVKYDKKQVALSSGLDVDGVIQPRSIRMLAPVTGYQVVGPSSVDLLQNSEYGNSQGHDSLYSVSSLPKSSASDIKASTSLGEYSTNLEGRDVGLLPMWHAFYPTALDLNIPALAIPSIVVRDRYYDNHSTQQPAGWGMYPTSTLRTATVPIVFSPNQTSDESSINSAEYRLGIPGNQHPGGNEIDTLQFFRLFIFPAYEESDDSGGNLAEDGYYQTSGLTIASNTVSYRLPLIVTKYYRPRFDKTSFFRKGVHSASIHAHHPYFDPMFYWVHSASSINFGRRLLYKESRLGDTHIGATSRYVAGSYRQGTGCTNDYEPPEHADLNVLDAKVNPDAYIPPGKTGFIVPIDPPHGSKLVELKLNMSIRPLASRAMTSSTTIGGVRISYGLWHSTPTLPSGGNNNVNDLTGSYWLDKDGWDEKEGYLVRLWKHSPFDEGSLFGENPDGDEVPSITANSINMEGNAVLLHEEVVNLRTTGNGSIGNPANLVDATAGTIIEGMSRLQVKLPDEDNMLVDRSAYSYFITIEFYTGVRKEVSLETTSGSSVSCYHIPGYNYDKMDRFNSDHIPYMWTSAFPAESPTMMSSIYGNDAARKWEGYWSPYPYNAGLTESHTPISVVRGSLLNSRPDFGKTVDGITYRFKEAEISTTIDVSKTEITGDYISLTQGDDYNDVHGIVTTQSNNVIRDMLDERGVFDHTVWYPVIKFRGLRIAYELDRPGHGGWGG